MRRRRGAATSSGGDDLFSVEPSSYVGHSLGSLSWPEQQRFPVNHAQVSVRSAVTPDLINSDKPLLVAGYSSIAALVQLVASWRNARGERPGTVRLLLGSEPFGSSRPSFASADDEFAEQVRSYWLEHSVSVRLSAKVIRALEQLDNGSLQVRALPGERSLHAKIYVGDQAATVGSSNFTDYGLSQQLEANARFDRSVEPRRFTELAAVADNFWSVGQPWNDEFRKLLMELLKLVSWQEALARACAELLEGDWAGPVLADQMQRGQLWPSQAAGIAQALWVVENLGSVLVADATGSGKTRMGAHLVAALRHRLLDTGRLRRDRDLTTLVCPPAVQETWKAEALTGGVTIMPVSQGLLSRSDDDTPRAEDIAVQRAQVLAVDEAHNFLAAASKRTRRVRDTLADHVLLFTATPISRGAQDLLSLVGLLGADNFDDETLEVLERLERGARLDDSLSDVQRDRLRREIQRFTVRRTKSALNQLVTQNEQAYRHPETGRVCRYPVHLAQQYETGETSQDVQAAEAIRHAVSGLRGLGQLGRRLAVPQTLGRDMKDEQWLKGRLAAARGLAQHQVLAAMRSSRAALIEHVAGTAEAIRICNLPPEAKSQATGDLLGKARGLAQQGPPSVELQCDQPAWLKDPTAWQQACEEEARIYEAVLADACRIGEARDRTKAELLERLAQEHARVLAFDQHPITLAAIRTQLPASDAQVLVADGEAAAARKRVRKLFARDSTANAIALCSDALNEGLNLQGAAALVHLDLPTTLRVAEQRVGRVDRMDSPHDQISVWWPADGSAFATRATEVLLARRRASESLLGSNLPMPQLNGNEDRIVHVDEHIRDLERPDLAWDGIRDALDPVRDLIDGVNALVPPTVYAEHRNTRQRVMARVAPVSSPTPWAFLALSGTQQGAPRWLLLEGDPPRAVIGVEAVAERLRIHLNDDPPNIAFDDDCEQWLDRFLTAAGAAENKLLPRRMQRAIDQMVATTGAWSEAASRRGDHADAQAWQRLAKCARPQPGNPDRLDPYLVAEAWWDLVRPLFELVRRPGARYSRLRDLKGLLHDQPLELATVQKAVASVPLAAPIDRRINALILGVPRP